MRASIAEAAGAVQKQVGGSATAVRDCSKIDSALDGSTLASQLSISNHY